MITLYPERLSLPTLIVLESCLPPHPCQCPAWNVPSLFNLLPPKCNPTLISRKQALDVPSPPSHCKCPSPVSPSRCACLGLAHTTIRQDHWFLGCSSQVSVRPRGQGLQGTALWVGDRNPDHLGHVTHLDNSMVSALWRGLCSLHHTRSKTEHLALASCLVAYDLTD